MDLWDIAELGDTQILKEWNKRVRAAVTPTASGSGSTGSASIDAQMASRSRGAVAHGQWARTPLHWASETGHSYAVELLVDALRVAPPLLPPDDDKWPGGAATEADEVLQAQVSSWFSALGGLRRVRDLDVKDETGWTPLHWACRGGHEEVCRVLLGLNRRTPSAIALEAFRTRVEDRSGSSSSSSTSSFSSPSSSRSKGSNNIGGGGGGGGGGAGDGDDGSKQQGAQPPPETLTMLVCSRTAVDHRGRHPSALVAKGRRSLQWLVDETIEEETAAILAVRRPAAATAKNTRGGSGPSADNTDGSAASGSTVGCGSNSTSGGTDTPRSKDHAVPGSILSLEDHELFEEIPPALHLLPMVNNHEFADCVLILDDESRFYAHKIFLCQHEYFRALLVGGLARRVDSSNSEGRLAEFLLSEVTPEMMMHVLRFIYCGLAPYGGNDSQYELADTDMPKPDTSTDAALDIVELLRTADRLLLPRLKHLCERLLCQEFVWRHPGMVGVFLTVALEFHCARLAAHCVSVARRKKRTLGVVLRSMPSDAQQFIRIHMDKGPTHADKTPTSP